MEGAPKGLGRAHLPEANRHKDYEASRRLIALSENHPFERHAKGAAFVQAKKDMDAIAGDSCHRPLSDYRSAFRDGSSPTVTPTSSLRQVGKAAGPDRGQGGAAYQGAPPAERMVS